MSNYPPNLPLAVFAAESEGRLRFRRPLVTYTNVFAPDAMTVWMSPQVESITGYRADEWVGQPGFFESILFPDDRASVLEEVRASRAELRPFSRDYRLVARSGRVVWVQDESVPVLDAAGEPEFIQGYFVDLSKRKELEKELLHAQKTEALGLLAADIAHDFNNYLTAIRGYADLGLLSTASDHPARKDLIEIAQTAGRATKLTQQLLTFGCRQSLEPQRIHLEKVVCDLASMLDQVAGWRVDLVFDLSPTPLVDADAGQLGQVIVNLVSNARDAMPAGGTVTLSTSCARVRQGNEAMRLDLAPGVYVELSVSDTGTGMDSETKTRVFDPFFTTKPSDRGTGLGLSIVHGIVRQSGGAVDVVSEPGFGTTFRLLLPSLQ